MRFINKGIPRNIDTSKLEIDCMQYMDSLRNYIGFVFDDSKITVKFSEKIKRDTLISKDIKAYDDVMRDLIRIYPDAEEKIKDIFKEYIRNDKEELINHLADSIVCSREKCNYDDGVNKLKKIFGKYMNPSGLRGVYLLGEYIHSENEPTVVLYSSAIEKCNLTNSIMDAYEEVLIHELFHAYHYQYAAYKNGKDIFERSDYTSSVIKESLASYFEKCFCEKNNISTTLLENWNSFDVTTYPYSGARHIHDTSIFTNILCKSVQDMDKALRDLLPPTEFYAIKNIGTRLKRKSTVKKASRIFIKFKNGYTSFLQQNRVEEYVIDGKKLAVTYGDGLRFPIIKQNLIIKEDDYQKIVLLFEKYFADLCPSDNNITYTNHGPLQSYDYEFKQKKETNVGEIFNNENANAKFDSIIRKYIS